MANAWNSILSQTIAFFSLHSMYCGNYRRLWSVGIFALKAWPPKPTFVQAMQLVQLPFQTVSLRTEPWEIPSGVVKLINHEDGWKVRRTESLLPQRQLLWLPEKMSTHVPSHNLGH
jgi:hypothetical protein